MAWHYLIERLDLEMAFPIHHRKRHLQGASPLSRLSHMPGEDGCMVRQLSPGHECTSDSVGEYISASHADLRPSQTRSNRVAGSARHPKSPPQATSPHPPSVRSFDRATIDEPRQRPRDVPRSSSRVGARLLSRGCLRLQARAPVRSVRPTSSSRFPFRAKWAATPLGEPKERADLRLEGERWRAPGHVSREPR